MHERNAPTYNELEGLPLAIKNLIAIRGLTSDSIYALASTSFANARLFTPENRHLWNQLLIRDFNTECTSGQPKELYLQLQEKQRIIVYTQFFLNPVIEPIQQKALPRPWFTVVDAQDKARYHAMTVLRDLLARSDHHGFMRMIHTNMAPIDADYRVRQCKELSAIFAEIFETSPTQAKRNIASYLSDIKRHDDEFRTVSPLTKTHSFMIMIHMLSKCGAIRALKRLLANLSLDLELMKMFYDRFGAELCIDAILYHRPSMIKTLLTNPQTELALTQWTTNNDSSDAALPEEPVHYAAANYTAATAYMEDTMLTPLTCAIKAVRTFYHQTVAAEVLTPMHYKRLIQFQEIISLLCKANANPDKAVVELDLDTRTAHVSLAQNARDLARALLQEIQLDRRLDEKFLLQLGETVEYIIGFTAMTFRSNADYTPLDESSSENNSDDSMSAHASPDRRNNPDDDDNNELTPTKRTRINNWSLR